MNLLVGVWRSPYRKAAMAIWITRSHEPPSEEAVREFEVWLGHGLPEKYRRFLLRNNGGVPIKHLTKDCFVQCFHALEKRPGGLRSEVEGLRGYLPSDLIPIAMRVGESQVCLSLANGKIYLAVEAEDGAEEPNLGELRLIAEDIDNLLEQLDRGSDDEGAKPSPEEEEIKNIGQWGNVSRLNDYLREGKDINRVTDDGGSIMKYAIYERNLPFLQECIRCGADLHGKRLLHAAAFMRDPEMADYLLGQGLDPNELDERQRTPLAMVIDFSDSGQLPAWASIAEYLWQRGGKIRAAQLDPERALTRFDFGDRTVRVPSGWSMTEASQILFLSTHGLKAKVMLRRAFTPPREVPKEGERMPFYGNVFAGHLEQRVILPSFFAKLLFGHKSHTRMEWIVEGDGMLLMAVYLAEPDEEPPTIKVRVEELLRDLECEPAGGAERD